MNHEVNFSLTKRSRVSTPRLPFEDMKDKILGKSYILSLVFIGEKYSRDLNKKYRSKDTPTNILTFPLENNEGEIFITPLQVRKGMKKFDMNYREFFALIFIHGLLHLKGASHGSTMERMEEKWLKKFTF